MVTSDAHPRRMRWTRDQCKAFLDPGILPNDDFELIDGEILPKLSQNEAHVRYAVLLLRALVQVFGWDFVRSQAPVALGPSDELEPDGAVTMLPASAYLGRDTPGASDIRLAVEISDSTLAFDRTDKAGIYGSSGIPEYWVVDLTGRRLMVFRNPQADGYGSIQTWGESESVSPLASPETWIRVVDLLP